MDRELLINKMKLQRFFFNAKSTSGFLPPPNMYFLQGYSCIGQILKSISSVDYTFCYVPEYFWSLCNCPLDKTNVEVWYLI